MGLLLSFGVALHIECRFRNTYTKCGQPASSLHILRLYVKVHFAGEPVCVRSLPNSLVGYNPWRSLLLQRIARRLGNSTAPRSLSCGEWQCCIFVGHALDGWLVLISCEQRIPLYFPAIFCA